MLVCVTNGQKYAVQLPMPSDSEASFKVTKSEVAVLVALHIFLFPRRDH